jgi:hypothetical protein
MSHWWENNLQVAQKLFATKPMIRYNILTAYLESPMNDTVDHKTIMKEGSEGRDDKKEDAGEIYESLIYKVPLPRRTGAPEDLNRVEYPQLRSCNDLPAKLPTDRGLLFDAEGNIAAHSSSEPMDARYCPVDGDSFLPWLHDVFPDKDGTNIHFIAQNKRRCQTGPNFFEHKERLRPQLALFQSISVQRIDESIARALGPDLWRPSDEDIDNAMPRYRLSPHSEADQDAQETRFICRFHTLDFTTSDGIPRPIILNETLSRYRFNYEYIASQRGKIGLMTLNGDDKEAFYTSTLQFSCPVPGNLQFLVKGGSTILDDGTPTLWVDVIPIRTSPRFMKEVYFPEGTTGPYYPRPIYMFNATSRWGDRHVLPRIEASGRLSNIPICRPPALEAKLPTSLKHLRYKVPTPTTNWTEAPHTKPVTLTACLWVSASYHHRGNFEGPVDDTKDRLYEWIHFHLLVGFEHIYVYDNSGANTNQTSMEDITKTFPSTRVTRIDWPSRICNNNVPKSSNPGERSSQYAAENSCLARYGPLTEWMGIFDVDEYMVPMGKYTSMKDVVKDADRDGVKILNFRSTRGKLRADASFDIKGRRTKLKNKTFLEAYNCDSVAPPKPGWGERAKKQLFRADYVVQKFVHYIPVSQNNLITFRENQRKSPSHE